MQAELDAGRQIYIVSPLIEESETRQQASAIKELEKWRDVFPDVNIGLLHGRLSAEEKDAVMGEFRTAATKILVATTVIEVGVNVPNASVMMIESADRFGLSQLHQLRGRVGRGADQSYCILVTQVKLSSESKQRMEVMSRTCDGFEISEVDLKMRGPGDLEGTQQSGVPFNLKIANLVTDGQIVQQARQLAIDILDEDPELLMEKNLLLNLQLNQLAKKKINWGVIS